MADFGTIQWEENKRLRAEVERLRAALRKIAACQVADPIGLAQDTVFKRRHDEQSPRAESPQDEPAEVTIRRDRDNCRF